jgi:glycosyltransferase involved in cell wall biosynthesis
MTDLQSKVASLKKQFPKVAVVADQMSAFGGADREMFSLLKLVPHADIFTIIFDKNKYQDNYPDLDRKVHTSFVQKISDILPKHFYRHLKILTPFAYESFNLRGYDLVISISAGPGKGVITELNQPHVAMVMTPPRSLWDKELNVRGSKFKALYKPLSVILNTYMRIWDWTTSRRVNYWVANSKYIARKIKKIYDKEATIIYPGVESKYFIPSSQKEKKKVREKYNLPKEFVLVVSRLYDHKRVDWAIHACVEAKKNLVIVGEGPDRKYLEKEAKGHDNIQFLGFVKDDMEVKTIYELADVLLFCGLEDFGLVPVEAMASGTPVLGYQDGGLLETIKGGVTGEFFKTEENLKSLLINFDKRRYNREEIKKHAQQFCEEKFLINLNNYLNQVYEEKKERE